MRQCVYFMWSVTPLNDTTINSSNVGRPPRSFSILGNGLLRISSQGYFQSWTRFGAMRIEEARQLFGRVVGRRKIIYSAVWSDDVTNSGYSPSHSERIVFQVGKYDGDIGQYNRMTRLVDYALREATGGKLEPLPLTVDMVMGDLDKPTEVNEGLWRYGRSMADDALYFMQRPGTPSARGARFIVNQQFVPETPDQIADVAILNSLKFVYAQHQRQQAVIGYSVPS